MADVESEDSPAVLFKKRGPKKASMRKRAATPPEESSSDADSTDDEHGQRVKRRRKTKGTVIASNQTRAVQPVDTSKASLFAADRSATIAASDDATKQSNWYEDAAAKELLGTTRPRPSNAPTSSLSYDTSVLSKKKKNEDEPKDGGRLKAKGPVKAPTNIRTITITDYRPDVCKDYKQTGHCGFGDACIYLHSREDYAQGWQLDKEWEKVTQGKKNLAGTVVARRKHGDAADGAGDEEDAAEAKLLEGIPFACIICKDSYKNPIVTRCTHYFCEACALKRFRKTPACAQCGAGTGGVFNGAKNLRKLLDKKRERAAKAKEKARENGEEVSGDEDQEAAA